MTVVDEGALYCPNGSGDAHHRTRALSYEKSHEPPAYESRGANLVVTRGAFIRYWIVWTCDACKKVWWEEDAPQIAIVSP